MRLREDQIRSATNAPRLIRFRSLGAATTSHGRHHYNTELKLYLNFLTAFEHNKLTISWNYTQQPVIWRLASKCLNRMQPPPYTAPKPRP